MALIPDLVSRHAAANPDHEAVFSTKHSLTYGELDRLSSILAQHLWKLGVYPETVVPFCIEKSSWAVVAVLSILKAGGVFVPLDPEHPVNRRQALVDEVNAQFMVVSPSTHPGCADMAPNMVEISPALFERLLSKPDELADRPDLQPKPSNAAYILFTSGSTGKPKGVIMEHQALTSSTMGQGEIFDLSPKSRVFQFSNFVFDGSLGELITPLAFGATVCMPSETERLQDAPDFIARARINTAMLTPSFVRTFTPEQVPTLKTLILGGEASSRDMLEQWFGKVRLINGYGPAEACNYCSVYDFQSATEAPSTIGRGFANSCWIVEQDDHNKQTPIGCTGELVVQGPTLARGYVNDSKRTNKSFIDSVDFLEPRLVRSPYRFYLTGDLVRLGPGGNLEYLGRKDTQIKVRGQRMEPGEVEYAIKKIEGRIEHAAVDVVPLDGRQTLVGFISLSADAFEDRGNEDSDFLELTTEMQDMLVNLSNELKALLPSYMVPSLFLPVRIMPFSSSMKIDRRKLKGAASDMSAEQRSSFSLVAQQKVEPTTEMEFRLRDIWAQVLHMSPEDIGKTDSFLHIGGDSITAIQLVSLAQQNGIGLSISNIFKDARLDSLALTAVSSSTMATYEVAPFSMVSESVEAINKEFASQCKLDATQTVEDAFPCNSLQQGLMALSMKQPGSYIVKHAFKLADSVNIDKFMAAWNRTMEICGNLRTRIIEFNGVSIQAIIKNDTEWDSVGQYDLPTLLAVAAKVEMTYATRLNRYCLSNNSDGSHYFVWMSHHSVFDGWSVGLVMDTLFKV
jgi:amino acid adenylation domain-containing protein